MLSRMLSCSGWKECVIGTSPGSLYRGHEVARLRVSSSLRVASGRQGGHLMSDERFKNEITQLTRLKNILQSDVVLPLRFDIQPLGLGYRRFKLTITGITSLVMNPGSSALRTANTFTVNVEVPLGYPWTAKPEIRFEPPLPFHPHIWPAGSICWGSGNNPNPDLTLADWIRGVVEYLQYNQDQASLLRMNPSSPANREAMQWWQSQRGSVSRYVPPIDMARLRVWINQTRG